MKKQINKQSLAGNKINKQIKLDRNKTNDQTRSQTGYKTNKASQELKQITNAKH